MALQFANPALQEIEQTPETQTGEEFGRVGQTLVQVPHLLLFVLRFTSQPSEANPLQLAKPTLHAIIKQAPLLQPTVALGNVGQAFPQAPQLLEFDRILTSHPSVILALQFRKLPVQIIEHTPETQTDVAFAAGGHVNPHDPQLLTLLDILISHPSLKFKLQLPKLGLQIIEHTPETQEGVEFGLVGHIVPHVPQLFASASRFISQPSLLFTLQFANPALQEIEQTPDTQTGEEFGKVGQTFPHEPQLLGSERTGAPLSINPSQLSSIALHNSFTEGLIFALLSSQSELFKTYPAG